MCNCLEVSKSGYYDWHSRAPSKRTAAYVTLLAQIEAAHTKSDATYGMPRIRAELADQGVVASRKRITAVTRLAIAAWMLGKTRKQLDALALEKDIPLHTLLNRVIDTAKMEAE